MYLLICHSLMLANMCNTQHNYLNHTGEPSVAACIICQKQYRDEATLSAHVRTVHNSGRFPDILDNFAGIALYRAIESHSGDGAAVQGDSKTVTEAVSVSSLLSRDICANSLSLYYIDV